MRACSSRHEFEIESVTHTTCCTHAKYVVPKLDSRVRGILAHVVLDLPSLSMTDTSDPCIFARFAARTTSAVLYHVMARTIASIAIRHAREAIASVSHASVVLSVSMAVCIAARESMTHIYASARMSDDVEPKRRGVANLFHMICELAEVPTAITWRQPLKTGYPDTACD